MRQRKSLKLYPLTMCYLQERTQKCTKLFFNHYLVIISVVCFFQLILFLRMIDCFYDCVDVNRLPIPTCLLIFRLQSYTICDFHPNNKRSMRLYL